MEDKDFQSLKKILEKYGHKDLPPEKLCEVVQNIEQLADLIYKFEERRKSNFGLSPPDGKK